MYLSIVAFVLTKALLSEVCHALNVTVTPGPVVMVTEKDNLTLSCLVSQRKRSNSVLILRWFYSPPVSPTTIPKDSSPHPSTQEPNQFLIAKLGIKKIKLYGNYTRRFPKPKFRLFEEQEGELFRLWILNVSGMDQGLYSCKVQEIRKLRNTWRSSSNGTGSTQLMDVYLGAVLICCLGLLSIFFFTLVLSCQYFYRRHRLKSKEKTYIEFGPNHMLTLCIFPNSSGETVTSSSSSSSSSPKALRKDTRPTIPARTITPPTLPREPPPHTPNKGKTILTYAELELVRPRPHPSALSSADPTPSDSDTVYAQILFQEKQL
ncbi:hypothetical protein NQD34_011362 [Periophthalmus magnuspinnatus]|nr:hypothetical protein NQD34_011362 [Periophthalmus magnuspinnatus]